MRFTTIKIALLSIVNCKKDVIGTLVSFQTSLFAVFYYYKKKGRYFMKNTSLCYLEQNDSYLMLHRIKKHQDANQGKWIGVGGKFEDKESPEDCVIREVQEETGFLLDSWSYRGIVTFVSDQYETEYMHLFTSSHFHGTLKECEEGVLQWIPKKQVLSLPLWEGDYVFLSLLEKNCPFFSLKLVYNGDTLTQAVLNGTQELSI